MKKQMHTFCGPSEEGESHFVENTQRDKSKGNGSNDFYYGGQWSLWSLVSH